MDVRLGGALVCFTMPRQHELRCGFQFACLSFKVGTGTASRFGGIARQFHAINGKHFAPDQALLVAQAEYLTEDAGDVVTQCLDKPGKGGEVRPTVAGQGDEGDVFAAGALDVAAADDALRVGKQDHFEQHGGRIGCSTCFVVAEPRIETG